MGYNSMSTQRMGLEITGQNLANVNTPNAARQRVNIVQEISLDMVRGQQGMGAYAERIESLRSSLLDQQVVRQQSLSGLHTTVNNLASLVEDVMGENLTTASAAQVQGSDSLSGLQNSLSSFFDAWQAVSQSPNSFIARENLVASAENVVRDMTTAYDRLLDAKAGIIEAAGDASFSGATGTTGEINRLSLEIAQLNQDISRSEVGTDAKANDLRDRRQELVEQLAKLVDITVTEHTGNPRMLDIQLADSAGTSVTGVTYDVATDVVTIAPPPAHGAEVRLAPPANGTLPGGLNAETAYYYNATDQKLYRDSDLQEAVDIVATQAVTTVNPDTNSIVVSSPPPDVGSQIQFTGAPLPTGLAAAINYYYGNGGVIYSDAAMTSVVNFTTTGTNVQIQPQASLTMTVSTVSGNTPVNLVNGAFGANKRYDGTDATATDPVTYSLSIGNYDRDVNSSLTVHVVTNNTAANTAYGTDIVVAPTEGILGGQMKVANQVLGTGVHKDDALLNRLNQLAEAFATQINNTQLGGWDLNGNPGGRFFAVDQGNPPSATTFTQGLHRLNSHMFVSEALRQDASLVAASNSATGYELNGGNAIDMAQLRDNGVASLANSSIMQFHRIALGDVGLTAEQAERDVKSQELVAKQILAQREAVSGISTDEETANLIKYQRAYESSARFINTVNEMMMTVIGLGR
jgi:flagellar hook-associated protein 1 FlgK